MRSSGVFLLALCLALPASAGEPRRRTRRNPGTRTGPDSKPGRQPQRRTRPSSSSAPRTGPTGEPADGGGADVRVEKSQDTVILTDGTKIVGTIIAAGQRAVIIIEQGAKKERVIKR